MWAPSKYPHKKIKKTWCVFLCGVGGSPYSYKSVLCGRVRFVRIDVRRLSRGCVSEYMSEKFHDETIPDTTLGNGKLFMMWFYLYISLSALMMSSVWEDKSFKQSCILIWFLGWTFVFETLECGNILAARNSANPKVIFVHPPNNPPLRGKNEPTRRMRWKQFFLMPLWHIPETLSFHVTWVEVKPWALKKLVLQSTSTPDANKSTRPKRNINTFCEAVVCTPFLQLRDFYFINLKWREEGAQLLRRRLR